METSEKVNVTVSVAVQAPVEKVWTYWTEPQHITQWNNASDDWHTPYAENDLKPGGKFMSRMEAKDGSLGFDFAGIYDEVQKLNLITCTLDDGRKVKVMFQPSGYTTRVEETFEAENENPAEMQRSGWQSILDSFKKYTEAN